MHSSPGPTETAAPAHQVALVRRACALLDAEDERLTLKDLAGRLGVSPWHLQRIFKKVTGLSPRDYSDAQRSERFRSELRNGESVAGATYAAGYGSSSRVYEGADRRLGMTPASYAKGGRGARITYAVVDSPLGRLLVAATTKGVCYIRLDDDEQALIDKLRAEFPAAEEIRRDEAAIAPAVKELLAYLEGRQPHVDLPLDVRATAFQRRVWQELYAIPYGETRSYGEVAAALGLPRGQRAVGRACGDNPVPLLVPCHRVLRSDGALGGYGLGLDRKRRLLDQEASTKQ